MAPSRHSRGVSTVAAKASKQRQKENGANDGGAFDTFLTFLRLKLHMASNPRGQLRTNPVCRRTKHFDTWHVKYVVMRDVLSIEVNPPASPKLVMIPAKSVVERKGASSAAGFVELIWEHRTHMIFEADLTRLNADRNGRQVAAPRLT